MKWTLYITALLLCLLSCSPNGELELQKDDESTSIEGLQAVDLSSNGLPLTAFISKETAHDFRADWNDTFGRMEVSDESGLNLFIQETEYSCTDKKQEIESSIFEVEYNFDNDSILCYTTTLPDGTPAYSHIFASFEINGVNYAFENNPLVECNPSQIAHMKTFVENMSGAGIAQK